MKIYDIYGRLLTSSGSYNIDAFLENPPTEDEDNKAPTSEWAFDHAVATTGIHGVTGTVLGTEDLDNTAGGTDGEVAKAPTSNVMFDHVALIATAHGGVAWVAYTPSVTNITLGNGTIIGNYCRIGKMVFFTVQLIMGSTSAMGTNPRFSLPVTSSATLFNGITYAYIEDAGTGFIMGWATMFSTTQVQIWVVGTGGTYASGTVITSTVPFTWTTSDELRIHGCYTAA